MIDGFQTSTGETFAILTTVSMPSAFQSEKEGSLAGFKPISRISGFAPRSMKSRRGVFIGGYLEIAYNKRPANSADISSAVHQAIAIALMQQRSEPSLEPGVIVKGRILLGRTNRRLSVAQEAP